MANLYRKKKVLVNRIITFLLAFVISLITISSVGAGVMTVSASSQSANYNSWLDGWDTGDTYDGITTFLDDEEEVEEGESDYFSSLLEAAVSWLVKHTVSVVIISFADNMGATVENVVYGRVGTGSTNYFQFGLEDGNVYGVVGSIMYALFRNFIFLLFAIQFVWMLASYLLKGTGKGRSDLKGSIYNFTFLFALLYAVPVLVDIAIFLKDSLLKAIAKSTASISGSYNLGVTDVIIRETEDDWTIFGAVLLCCVCGAGIYFAVDYLKRAVMQVYLFGTFPIVAFRSFSDKQILNKWVGQFITSLFVPLFDAIALWMVILVQNYNRTAVNNGPAILGLIVYMSIIPCRNMIMQFFGMPVPGKGFNLMAAALMLRGLSRAGGRNRDSDTSGGDKEKNRMPSGEGGDRKPIESDGKNQDESGARTVGRDGAVENDEQGPVGRDSASDEQIFGEDSDGSAESEQDPASEPLENGSKGPEDGEPLGSPDDTEEQGEPLGSPDDTEEQGEPSPIGGDSYPTSEDELNETEPEQPLTGVSDEMPTLENELDGATDDELPNEDEIRQQPLEPSDTSDIEQDNGEFEETETPESSSTLDEQQNDDVSNPEQPDAEQNNGEFEETETPESSSTLDEQQDGQNGNPQSPSETGDTVPPKETEENVSKPGKGNQEGPAEVAKPSGEQKEITETDAIKKSIESFKNRADIDTNGEAITAEKSIREKAISAKRRLARMTSSAYEKVAGEGKPFELRKDSEGNIDWKAEAKAATRTATGAVTTAGSVIGAGAVAAVMATSGDEGQVATGAMVGATVVSEVAHSAPVQGVGKLMGKGVEKVATTVEHQTVTDKGRQREWNRPENIQKKKEFEEGLDKLKRINNGTQGVAQNDKQPNRANVPSKEPEQESGDTKRERVIKARSNIKNAADTLFEENNKRRPNRTNVPSTGPNQKRGTGSNQKQGTGSNQKRRNSKSKKKR